MSTELFVEELESTVNLFESLVPQLKFFKNDRFFHRLDDTLYFGRKNLIEHCDSIRKRVNVDIEAMQEDLHWMQKFGFRLRAAVQARDYEDLNALADQSEDEFLQDYGYADE